MFAINAANKKSKHTIFSLDTPSTHTHTHPVHTHTHPVRRGTRKPADHMPHTTHHIQTINMKNIFSGFAYFFQHFFPPTPSSCYRVAKCHRNVSQMMLSMSIFNARVINFRTHEICGNSLKRQPKSYVRNGDRGGGVWKSLKRGKTLCHMAGCL